MPPAPKPRLILIGLRGSGKSTLARELSHRLACGWLDLDDLTPRELGCESVAEAWSVHGERAFRAAEAAALGKALATDAYLLALGGGTPTAPGAELLLRAEQAAGARIVYLRATPAVLRDRLLGKMDPNRPSLTGDDPLNEIDAVFAQRDEPYRLLADRVIEMDRLSMDEALEYLASGAHS